MDNYVRRGVGRGGGGGLLQGFQRAFGTARTRVVSFGAYCDTGFARFLRRAVSRFCISRSRRGFCFCRVCCYDYVIFLP